MKTRTNLLILDNIEREKREGPNIWRCYIEMTAHAQNLELELKVAYDKIQHLQSLLDQPSGDCDYGAKMGA